MSKLVWLFYKVFGSQDWYEKTVQRSPSVCNNIEAWSFPSAMQPSQAARRPKFIMSLEWHHNNVWLQSFYPPYCHCCTWPPGRADGTCAHICQVCPPALAWCLCAAGRLHSRTTWPASPCRWYNPGVANQNTSAAILHDCVFMRLSHFKWCQSASLGRHKNCLVFLCLFLTSSGITLILSVYLRTTSSGFFPCHKIKRKRDEMALEKKAKLASDGITRWTTGWHLLVMWTQENNSFGKLSSLSAATRAWLPRFPDKGVWVCICPWCWGEEVTFKLARNDHPHILW